MQKPIAEKVSAFAFTMLIYRVCPNKCCHKDDVVLGYTYYAIDSKVTQARLTYSTFFAGLVKNLTNTKATTTPIIP